MPKIQKVLHETPSLTHIIVIMDKHNESNYEQIMLSKPSHLKIYTIKEIESIGSMSGQEVFEKPNKYDLAIIMYTSGSTGIL